MVKYIEFGEYNKNYKFIFLVIIFSILSNHLTIFLFNIFFLNKKISTASFIIFQHEYLTDTFTSFGIFIFSCFLLIYENKLSKSEKNVDKMNASNLNKGCFQNIKINEEKKKKLSNEKNLLIILMIIIIKIALDYINEIISILFNFDYFMFILLIISFINAKMFKIKTYKHHKCAIYLNFIVVFIFQLIWFILSMNLEENIDRKIYIKYKWLIPIGFIIYIIYVIILSYVYAKMKWFMDKNWISLSKLFMISAFLEFLIKSIICIISTFIECHENIIKFFCPIKKGEYYYKENFFIFFKKISIIFEEYKADLIFIICSIILDIFVQSIKQFLLFSILKNLYPEYYFFSIPIVEIFYLVYSIFSTKILNGFFFAKEGEDYKLQLIIFIIKIIQNFFSLIGLLIYLEIIELNFCGFNFNLRKNIMKRSDEDAEGFNLDIEQNEALIDNGTQNKLSELSINTPK